MGRQTENDLLDMLTQKERKRAEIIKRIDALKLVIQMRQEKISA